MGAGGRGRKHLWIPSGMPAQGRALSRTRATRYRLLRRANNYVLSFLTIESGTNRPDGAGDRPFLGRIDDGLSVTRRPKQQVGVDGATHSDGSQRRTTRVQGKAHCSGVGSDRHTGLFRVLRNSVQEEERTFPGGLRCGWAGGLFPYGAE